MSFLLELDERTELGSEELGPNSQAFMPHGQQLT